MGIVICKDMRTRYFAGPTTAFYFKKGILASSSVPSIVLDRLISKLMEAIKTREIFLNASMTWWKSYFMSKIKSVRSHQVRNSCRAVFMYNKLLKLSK